MLQRLRLRPAISICSPCLRRLYSSPAVTLRPYQESAIQAVQSHISQGHRRLGISLATGSGKTVIFTQLIGKIVPPEDEPQRTQTIVLVHRKELAEQAFGHIQNAYPNTLVEVEMGNKKATGAADITICSVSTLTASSGARLQKFDPAKIKLVLLDECHHAVAKSWLKALEHFGALVKPEEGKGPVVVGVSATMSRFDGLALGKVLDHIVYHKDYVDMASDNWLSSAKFCTIHAKFKLEKVQVASTGDFAAGALSAVINTPETNELIVRSWFLKAAGRKSTLVFCVDIKHVEDLVQQFRDLGVQAYGVTGKTSKTERKDLLDRFRAREFPVLVNCAIFTEGTDIPNIDCVYLARPTRSKNLLIQMIGRGMRLYEGKTDCLVIDLVGSISRGLVTAPTLFGLDPDTVFENATLEEITQGLTARKFREPMQGPQVPGKLTVDNVTFTDYDTLEELLADVKADRFIHQISAFAWVMIGPGKYILASPTSGFIRVQMEEDGYWASYYTKPLPPHVLLRRHMEGITKGARHHKPEKIISGVASFEDIIRMSDKYASERFVRNLVLRNAEWRRSPASSGQLTYLVKTMGKEWVEENKRKLTKGSVTDMITKLKHGIKTNFKKRKAEEERLKKAEEKVQELRRREEVKVGPLEG